MSRAAAHLGLDSDFRAEQGAAAGSADRLVTSGEAMATRLLRRYTYASRPFSGVQYVVLFEQRFQRVWRTFAS